MEDGNCDGTLMIGCFSRFSNITFIFWTFENRKWVQTVFCLKFLVNGFLKKGIIGRAFWKHIKDVLRKMFLLNTRVDGLIASVRKRGIYPFSVIPRMKKEICYTSNLRSKSDGEPPLFHSLARIDNLDPLTEEQSRDQLSVKEVELNLLVIRWVSCQWLLFFRFAPYLTWCWSVFEIFVCHSRCVCDMV